MKKLFLFLFIIFSLYIYTWANENENKDNVSTVKIIIENKIAYDILGHEDFAANILLTWGGVSLGTGVFLINNKEEILKSIGIQNIIWGVGETGAALWFKGLIAGKKENNIDENLEIRKFQEILKYKFFIDLTLLGLGTTMYIYGNNSIKGHGVGIVIHNFFQMLFDGINYIVSKNLSERYE